MLTVHLEPNNGCNLNLLSQNVVSKAVLWPKLLFLIWPYLVFACVIDLETYAAGFLAFTFCQFQLKFIVGGPGSSTSLGNNDSLTHLHKERLVRLPAPLITLCFLAAYVLCCFLT